MAKKSRAQHWLTRACAARKGIIHYLELHSKYRRHALFSKADTVTCILSKNFIQQNCIHASSY